MMTETQYEWENKTWQPNHQPDSHFVVDFCVKSTHLLPLMMDETHGQIHR